MQKDTTQVMIYSQTWLNINSEMGFIMKTRNCTYKRIPQIDLCDEMLCLFCLKMSKLVIVSECPQGSSQKRKCVSQR